MVYLNFGRKTMLHTLCLSLILVCLRCEHGTNISMAKMRLCLYVSVAQMGSWLRCHGTDGSLSSMSAWHSWDSGTDIMAQM